MKTFGLFLMALAIVAFGVATSRAALISLYEFEDGSGTTVANTIDTQQDGTLMADATFGEGKIGSGGYLNAGTAGGVNITGTSVYAYEAWGSNNNAFWNGSWSAWVKWGSTTESVNSLSVAYYQDTGSSFRSSYIQRNDATSWLPKESMRKNGTYVFQHATTLGEEVTDTHDGGWHHLAYTYVITQGTSGTGSGVFYIDGNPVMSVTSLGTATSSLLQNSITGAAIFAIDTNGSLPWIGSGDDFAHWSNVLTETGIKALVNLGNDALNYGAKEAADLFDLYAGPLGGTASIGGQTWMKVASGLGEVGGAVVGSSALNLGGADGSGVQIVPEPGTLGLLLAGAIGLLVLAVRKRK